MSGHAAERLLTPEEQAEIASNVRRLSGTELGAGPDDAHLVAAVAGFVGQLDFWYVRVMKEAVPKYRHLIIMRINPFIRRIEYEGLAPASVADRLVEDYNARNFVTAGGWALEKMAVRISANAQKSAAEGLDIQRIDPSSGDYHLYVLKSGLVTRNSDILKSLKRNGRQAEKLLRQGRDDVKVHLNYAILAGKTRSTYEDGVRRPSSAEFWSEMTDVPIPKCIDLVLAVTAEAGRLVRRDAGEHIRALKTLVSRYIASPEDDSLVDWDFIAQRNMRERDVWSAEDRKRHMAACERLGESGYEFEKRKRKKGP